MSVSFHPRWFRFDLPRLACAALMLAGFACAARSASAQNVLLNGNFEATADLLPGQTAVAPNSQKILFESTAINGFAGGIHSIPNWINSYTDVGFGSGARDAGLRRVDFSGSGDSQYAFINNWETRLSQVSSLSVAANQSYSATIDVGMNGARKAGKFQLWAGRPSVANPDLFDGSAVLLREVTVASQGWTAFVPDVLVPLDQWTPLTINFTAPASGAMLGQPLTVSFLTANGSAGPVFWDNATLMLVPAPSATLLLGLSGLGAARRRR